MHGFPIAGFKLVVLSDTLTSAERCPLASLVAVGAVHHHLVKTSRRLKIGLLLGK